MTDEEEQYEKDAWAKEANFNSYEEYEDYLDMVEHSVEPYTKEEYEQNKIDIAERYEEEFLSLQQNKPLNTQEDGETNLQPSETGVQGRNGLLPEEGSGEARGIEGSADEQREDASLHNQGAGIVSQGEGAGQGVSVAQSASTAPTDLRDAVKPESAALGADEAKAKGVDNQGNPIDENGKYIVEKVEKIDDIIDEDFTNPTRNIELPKIPEKVDSALGAEGKPVIIKKNIFEKNRDNHKDLTPDDSRRILYATLYNPYNYEEPLVGQSQPKSRPNYWVAIESEDGKSVTVLEVNKKKDNVEIVGWHKIDADGLEKLKRQAEREGEQFLIQTSKKKAAAALSALPLGLSGGKGTEVSDTKQGKEGKNFENQISAREWNGHNVGDRYLLPDGSGSIEVIGFDYTNSGNGGMPEVLVRGYDPNGELMGTQAVPPLAFEESLKEMQKVEAEPRNSAEKAEAVPSYLPVLRKEYDEFKQKYPDNIIMFRTGDTFTFLADDTVAAEKVLRNGELNRDSVVKNYLATAKDGAPSRITMYMILQRY